MHQGRALVASYPDDLWESLADMSGLLLSTESLETTLSRVAALAVRCIAGCDAVGATLFENGRPTTRAATGGLVYEVDHYQYDIDDGPCLSAVRDGQVHQVLDMSTSLDWPEFCGHAAARGINSSMSLPLVVRGSALGALNFYSRTSRAFTEADLGVASAFAAQAAVALANAETYAASVHLAEQLREALSSRGVIDQAKGILMAQQGWTEEQAFEALRAISSRRNLKLRLVAAEMVAGVADGRVGAPAAVEGAAPPPASAPAAVDGAAPPEAPAPRV